MPNQVVNTMSKYKALLISIVAVLLTHCASYDFRQTIVQQGNLLPESKIQRLKTGMSKQEVAKLMGTSLVSPMFSRDRWDYAYTWRKGFSDMKQKHLELYFSGNELRKIKLN